ncbi:hypothetical protein [Saccharothrix coeruleofusca]|uniref:Uncharacterized protein n=1 Tax=Saccharothrix coeruleofusca TaxID=33919 RepID=A0A918ANL2_9PSEU|nr:hypothetical protein [Saccharothrix coeruleofusca]MBP2338147.1 hypothetical protein [Saccharothrix coeruleofusca]GGP50449.1 hypothetical protein GCM10010185_23370 [Saccharothrix coeruleofusca]
MTYPSSEPSPEAQPTHPVLEPYGLSTPAPQVEQPQTGPAFQPYGQFTPSTPPAGQPHVGPPFEPYGTAAAAPPGKRTAVVLLSVLAVLLLATAGVFGALYANQASRADQLATRLSDKERELTESGKQLENAKDEASKAKNDREIAEDARKRAENDGASMLKCRDAARALREAALANNEAKGEEAFLQLFAVC